MKLECFGCHTRPPSTSYSLSDIGGLVDLDERLASKPMVIGNDGMKTLSSHILRTSSFPSLWTLETSVLSMPEPKTLTGRERVAVKRMRNGSVQ